jgi:hypothetical protein
VFFHIAGKMILEPVSWYIDFGISEVIQSLFKDETFCKLRGTNRDTSTGAFWSSEYDYSFFYFTSSQPGVLQPGVLHEPTAPMAVITATAASLATLNFTYVNVLLPLLCPLAAALQAKKLNGWTQHLAADSSTWTTHPSSWALTGWSRGTVSLTR